MQPINLSSTLSLSVLYNDFMEVGTWWNYQDVISPFNRLYLITEGSGAVYLHGKKVSLSAGDLFLIPKFTFHSYECEHSMTHYFICFIDETLDGRIPIDIRNLKLKRRATDLDYKLMQRFLVLNPDNKLPSVDPEKYGKGKDFENKKQNQSDSAVDFIQHLESTGILMQLYSRFMDSVGLSSCKHLHSSEKIEQSIIYINQHLDRKIPLPELAQLSCLTVDHFSKVFKKVMGIPPCEYIIQKRVQRAEILLVTSDLSVSAIAEKVGITDLSQFSRLFSRLVHCSPREYRRKMLF